MRACSGRARCGNRFAARLAAVAPSTAERSARSRRPTRTSRRAVAGQAAYRTRASARRPRRA
eukprot:scaffold58452_cov67-Phaeocystis_antarctica.AAC.2